jgi:hypothetical protein
VLLASRPAWIISVILSAGCIVQVGRTYFPSHRVVQEALLRVHHAEEAFEDLRKAHAGANEDGKAIERVDPDGKIRAAIEARAKIHAPVAPEGEGKK